MSKRYKRNEIEDLAPPILEDVPAEDQFVQKMPFAHWFEKQLRSHKVRSHQDEALLVFFRKQGLKNAEDEDTYNKAFTKF